MNIPPSIHSSTDGCLECWGFRVQFCFVFAVIASITVTVFIPVSLCSVNMPQMFWARFLEAEFLGHRTCFCSALLRLSFITPPKWWYQFTFPPAVFTSFAYPGFASNWIVALSHPCTYIQGWAKVGLQFSCGKRYAGYDHYNSFINSEECHLQQYVYAHIYHISYTHTRGNSKKNQPRIIFWRRAVCSPGFPS